MYSEYSVQTCCFGFSFQYAHYRDHPALDRGGSRLSAISSRAEGKYLFGFPSRSLIPRCQLRSSEMDSDEEERLRQWKEHLAAHQDSDDDVALPPTIEGDNEGDRSADVSMERKRGGKSGW